MGGVTNQTLFFLPKKEKIATNRIDGGGWGKSLISTQHTGWKGRWGGWLRLLCESCTEGGGSRETAGSMVSGVRVSEERLRLGCDDGERRWWQRDANLRAPDATTLPQRQAFWREWKIRFFFLFLIWVCACVMKTVGWLRENLVELLWDETRRCSLQVLCREGRRANGNGCLRVCGTPPNCPRCLWWRASSPHKTPSWTPSRTTLMAPVSIFCTRDDFTPHSALQILCRVI